jgi:hypothetical protein
MAKKNKQVQDMELSAQEVEAVEEAAEAVAAPVEEPKVEEAKVSFDGWYALRSGVIPAVHKKEILKADFKGQRVPMIATMAEFDSALKKYGVTLV